VDGSDFDDFYHATAHRLLRYAYAMTGDLGNAQDLTQEAYIRAWQYRRRLSQYEHPEAWLRLVITRLATDRSRRRKVRQRAEAETRPPEPVPPPSEDGMMLAAALRQIPAGQRRAMALHYLLDMSVNDIAWETGASVGTIKSLLSRGRTSLAEVLGGNVTVVHGAR
jgi:RNA polymerase sigma-70 factor (ECF subfamily)